MRWLAILTMVFGSANVAAEACFTTSVMAPSPLMGNHGEIFRTTEGEIFEVIGSYEYLYAYYPAVTICPHSGKMMVEGITVGVRILQAATSQSAPSGLNRDNDRDSARTQPTEAPIKVVLRIRSCDYFIADGPQGYFLLEWYGGYDPQRGDGIYGELGSYGFKDVLYSGGQEGRLYIDDYMLSKDGALEELHDKCSW